jgi:hypothetical protein
MIGFSAGIQNPWSNVFRSVFVKDGSLTKNKTWEVEVVRTNAIVGFSFSLTARTDHAGVMVSVSFLSFDVTAHVYDTRHWDDEKGRWCDYPTAENTSDRMPKESPAPVGRMVEAPNFVVEEE